MCKCDSKSPGHWVKNVLNEPGDGARIKKHTYKEREYTVKARNGSSKLNSKSKWIELSPFFVWDSFSKKKYTNKIRPENRGKSETTKEKKSTTQLNSNSWLLLCVCLWLWAPLPYQKTNNKWRPHRTSTYFVEANLVGCCEVSFSSLFILFRFASSFSVVLCVCTSQLSLSHTLLSSISWSFQACLCVCVKHTRAIFWHDNWTRSEPIHLRAQYNVLEFMCGKPRLHKTKE